MAFRKRLIKRGYTRVSIRKIKGSDLFRVSAYEPLACSFVSVDLTLLLMYRAFRF